MKIKIVQDRRSGARTLHVKPGKSEKFVYEQAEWLADGPNAHLLDFTYLRGGDGGVDLYYDITGLVDLRSYLRAPLSTAQYAGLLSALEEVLALCNRRSYPSLSLRFDPEHVYVDLEVGLRFLFAPLEGGKTEDANTPNALLGVLGDPKKVSFVVADDSRHAAAVYDYVHRNPVLSLASYRQFLAQEFRLTFSTNTSGQLTGSATGPTGGSSGAIAGARGTGQMPQGTRNSGSLAGSGRIGQGESARQAVSATTFDPVAMLAHAPAASDVVQGQSIAERVRDGVSGTSPTAASPVEAAASAPGILQT
ncbi:MAG: hypothetical protein ACI364_03185, partial [Coriobacteriales bacterium]